MKLKPQTWLQVRDQFKNQLRDQLGERFWTQLLGNLHSQVKLTQGQLARELWSRLHKISVGKINGKN